MFPSACGVAPPRIRSHRSPCARRCSSCARPHLLLSPRPPRTSGWRRPFLRLMQQCVPGNCSNHVTFRWHCSCPEPPPCTRLNRARSHVGWACTHQRHRLELCHVRTQTPPFLRHGGQLLLSAPRHSFGAERERSTAKAHFSRAAASARQTRSARSHPGPAGDKAALHCCHGSAQCAISWTASASQRFCTNAGRACSLRPLLFPPKHVGSGIFAQLARCLAHVTPQYLLAACDLRGPDLPELPRRERLRMGAGKMKPCSPGLKKWVPFSGPPLSRAAHTRTPNWGRFPAPTLPEKRFAQPRIEARLHAEAFIASPAFARTSSSDKMSRVPMVPVGNCHLCRHRCNHLNRALCDVLGAATGLAPSWSSLRRRSRCARTSWAVGVTPLPVLNSATHPRSFA